MSGEVGLPDALERAACALEGDADAIRPANGDPARLFEGLREEGAARVLTWLLAHEPAAGEELALAWAEDDSGAAPVVLGLEAGSLPKSARKPLRRVLHRLRSRGLALPEPERPGERVARLPSLDEDLREGRVSALDPRGSRVVYLAQGHPSGGARLFEIFLDDQQGLLEFEVYSTGRSRVRRFLRDFERAGRLPGASAPPESVQALVARALAVHPEQRLLPRGFSEWRSRLTPRDAGAAVPGALVRAALGAHDDAAASLAAACRWLRAGEIGPWPPPQAGLLPIAERIAESGKSALTVSGAARREQVDRALEQACREIFDEAFAEVTALRLEETAYLLWRADREADARMALAAADVFRGPERADNALARELLEVLFAPVLRSARGDAGEAAGDAAPPLVSA